MILSYVEECVVAPSILSVRPMSQFVFEGGALEGVCLGPFLARGEKLQIVSGLWIGAW